MEIVLNWFAGRSAVSLLVALMIFDVITGVMRAIKFKVLASNINRNGMIWKTSVLLAVLFGKVLQFFTGELPVDLAEMIALGFCMTEGLSIIENFGLLGVPLPQQVKQFFIKLNPNATKDEDISARK